MTGQALYGKVRAAPALKGTKPAEAWAVVADGSVTTFPSTGDPWTTTLATLPVAWAAGFPRAKPLSEALEAVRQEIRPKT